MKKAISFLCLLLVFVGLYFIVGCFAEKAQLRENIVRLHVVANSDSAPDQAQKLRIRDRVTQYLQPILAEATSADEAQQILAEHLPQLKAAAEEQLLAEGSDYKVQVRLLEETFDIRHYDTFSLPSGVYSSLRIEIGDGVGKNWWCVVFPSLCMPAAGERFQDVAADAGFSDSLTDSLSNGNKVVFRFYVLDLLGNLENFFYRR
jgi:stage II sporulation protein R